ncbi:MAG: polyphosphate kinase 1, partial [Planctomycetes bacterium]|nr:polyphosphate kinase 1 [Planctomycetota bacterium]
METGETKGTRAKGTRESNKTHFVNREISWLEFNRRVLEEAQDESKPLLARAQFLAIVSSNLDEFFMVRVAQLHDLDAVLDSDPAGMSRQEQLNAVREMSQQLIEDQSRCWTESVKPGLLAEGIGIHRATDWTDEDRVTLRQLYSDSIEAILTPLAVDSGRPFPLIANGSIYIVLELIEKKENAERVNALIAVPKRNRLLRLLGDRSAYAPLEDVIESFADSLFPGFKVQSRCKIRLTRDGSLDIDEDATNDLLSEIEQELQHRGQGNPVRLEIEASAPDNLREWIQNCLSIPDADVFPVSGLLDFTVLHNLYGRESESFAHLCEDEHHPAPCPIEWEDPFAAIREQELLLYHPYQSYKPVVEIIRCAARDDEVLAIKMTLYRVGGDSPIIKHLIDAAHRGKQVTVMVELKARFDEKANIQWARRLEDAGAHVIYGIVGLKVHAKLLLIIRRDEDGIRRYCHLGTGNYNHRTAKLYTDYSYFTTNEAIGRDVSALFNMLTGFAQPPQWERLAVSPLTLRDHFYKWIHQEIEHARAGRPAMIKAKFNSLVDEDICNELYAA